MKGDFSRNTFDPTKHFSRILLQQGRVLLDSDWNEQTSVLLHYLRTLAADLIGPYGGPAQECGFAIQRQQDLPSSCTSPPPPDMDRIEKMRQAKLARNFLISRGRYYVEGLLCENDHLSIYGRSELAQFGQPDYTPDELENGKAYLVYLDAWERHLTSLDDEAIREVALGSHGPDTATRAKVVWQVKTFELRNTTFDNLTCQTVIDKNGRFHPAWLDFVQGLQPENRGLLKAKADEADDTDATDPCIISPEARYRGAENQLYRVEIHRGGSVNTPATFKWSRENGSTLLPVRHVNGQQVTLDSMGRDARFGLQIGDWVELVDDYYELSDGAEALLQVTNVDPIDMVVTLSGTPATTRTDKEGRTIERNNQLLRRWDHKAGDKRIGGLELKDGAALIKERTGSSGNWLVLEDGVQIQFEPNGNYRTGDYWLIPARTATGDVEWPGEVGEPEALPPHGIEHYYAPLARINVAVNGDVTVAADLRRKFDPLAKCDSRLSGGV